MEVERPIIGGILCYTDPENILIREEPDRNYPMMIISKLKSSRLSLYIYNIYIVY